MSSTHNHGSSPNPFTPAEWEKFHADDRHGAAVIIGLMGAIFTIGLCLYTYVCFQVM